MFLPPQLSALFSDMTLNSASTISIGSEQLAEKKKKLNRDGDTTGLVEVTVQGSCLMEKDASREAFGFSRDVIGSTRGFNIVKKLIVFFLKCIMTTLFVSLDMFVV